MTAAADELAALLERRAALAKTAHDIDVALTFSNVDVERAREQLAAAERARLNGTGSDQDVTAAEKRLSRAKTAAMKDTTPERLQGTRSALRDADRAISAHVAANYGELAGEQPAQSASKRRRAAGLPDAAGSGRDSARACWARRTAGGRRPPR